MPIRRRRVLRLEGVRPPQDLRSDRVSDVAELRVLFDERGNHRAEGDDAFAVRTGRLESFPHQDVRQAASAEPFIDLGVVENPLVVVVSDGGTVRCDNGQPIMPHKHRLLLMLDEFQEINSPPILQAIKEIGYRGYIALEYEGKGNPREDCPRYIDQIRAAFA